MEFRAFLSSSEGPALSDRGFCTISVVDCHLILAEVDQGAERCTEYPVVTEYREQMKRLANAAIENDNPILLR